MDGPMMRGAKNDSESWLQRARGAMTPAARAVWEHLRHNWTDGLLALGFLAVMVLSAYVMLKH